MDLKFYVSLFLRRLPYFLILLALGTAAGLTLATILPPVYTARAVLVVESERIPGELAASTVRTEATETLQIIRQRILTRARLLELANDFEIYGAPGSPERRAMTSDDIVRDLRGRIQIVTTGGSRRGTVEATLVTVSFQADNGRLAADVANEVVTAILEQNAELRRSVASETLEFFEDEVARLDRELARRSGDMLVFQEANLEALPDSLDFRRSQQAAAQERLVQFERAETQLRDRRDRLVELFENTGQVGQVVGEQQSAAEAELVEMRRRVSVAESTLGEGNPRLQILRNQLAAMEEVVAEERAAEAGTEVGTDPQLSAYEVQLADIDSQLDFVTDQKAQIEDELATLQETIEATPGNAVALETMERDYAAVRTQYDEAVANRARAETGEMIENLSKGQRVSVIEQAVAPSSPQSPDRKMIAAAGVGAGLAAGFGLIVLLELLNTSIRRPADLQNKLGIQPFGTLPLIRTPGQIRRRRATIAAAFLVVAVGVPAGLWYVQTEVMPLDLLLNRALNRLGVAGLLPLPGAIAAG